jgi:hypothetical protein
MQSRDYRDYTNSISNDKYIEKSNDKDKILKEKEEEVCVRDFYGKIILKLKY